MRQVSYRQERVIEYELNQKLAAACLTDIVDDGLSMVYSFYNPDLAKYSLGTYIVLDHIKLAQKLDLSYVYLGYWVPGSSKMGYKSKYSALEISAFPTSTPNRANCFYQTFFQGK